MDRGMALVQPKHSGGDWIWADSKFCHYSGSRVTNGRAFFECYFNEGDLCSLSATAEKILMRNNQSRAKTDNYKFTPSSCPKYVTDRASRARFRAASMEYLFCNVSRELAEAADQAAGEVFHLRDVPRDQMITLHVR